MLFENREKRGILIFGKLLRVGSSVYTSKWNKIEYRRFCLISQNWRKRALLSRQVVVNLIGETTTKAGLLIRAVLDENRHQSGIKVTDDELGAIVIERDRIHGEWNYQIKPHQLFNVL